MFFPFQRMGLTNVAAMGGGGIPAPTTPLRVVSTWNPPPRGNDNSTGTKSCVRWGTQFGTDTSHIRLSFSNWYLTNIGSAVGPNAMAVDEMSFEYNGVVVPVTFSGSRSKSLAAGDSDVQSDLMHASLFGVSQFSRDAQGWIKGIMSVTDNAHSIPFSYRSPSELSGQQVAWFDPANTTPSSTDVSGVYTATGTAFATRTGGYNPILIGHPVVDGPSFFVMGDSISIGVGDNIASAGYNGIGFIQRAMHQTDQSLPLPCLNFGLNGAGQLYFPSSDTRVQGFFQYARFAIDELGTNSVTSNTYFNMTTASTAHWTRFRSGGIEKILKTKIIPRTDSTDNFVTEANQTPKTGFAATELADQYNDWLDTKLADNSIEVLLTHSSVQGVDPFKWIVTGAANYSTIDGTHPSVAGHVLMAAELRTAITSL